MIDKIKQTISKTWGWIKSKAKWIFFATLGICSILAATAIIVPDIPDIPQELQLKTDKTDVIKYERFDVPEEVTATSTKEAKRMVKYLYKSEKEVPQQTYLGIKEDMNMRTKSSISVLKSEKDGVKNYESKIFIDSEPFYKENDKWYQTEIDEVPEDVFNEAMKVTWLDKLIGREVYATDSKLYVGAGDGVVGRDAEGTWAAARDTAAGETARATEAEETQAYSYYSGSTWYLYRAFFPINTGGTITSGATISSSTLHLYVSTISNAENDGNDYNRLVETSQADETTVGTGDYDECGTLNNPTALATDKDLGDYIDDTYNSQVLNATGRAAVKTSGDVSTCGGNTGWTCLGHRLGWDVVDDAPTVTGENRIVIRTSEYVDVTYDPWLGVEWSVVAAAAPVDSTQIIIWED